jgi:hypothetical protein
MAELVQDHGLEVVLIADRVRGPLRPGHVGEQGEVALDDARAGRRARRATGRGGAHAAYADVVLAQQRGGPERALRDEGAGEADVVVPVAQARDALTGPRASRRQRWALLRTRATRRLRETEGELSPRARTSSAWLLVPMRSGIGARASLGSLPPDGAGPTAGARAWPVSSRPSRRP